MASIWVYNPGKTPVKISANGRSLGGRERALVDENEPSVVRNLAARRLLITSEKQTPDPPGWVIAAQRRTDPVTEEAKEEIAPEQTAPKKAPAKRKKAAPKAKPAPIEQDPSE